MAAFKFPARTRSAEVNKTTPARSGKGNGSMDVGEKGKAPKSPKPMRRGK